MYQIAQVLGFSPMKFQLNPLCSWEVLQNLLFRSNKGIHDILLLVAQISPTFFEKKLKTPYTETAVTFCLQQQFQQTFFCLKGQ